ncbi:GAF domain-containing protein [Salinispira pacifica]|uniref:Methionine-(R)-sulfoxide reductase n=1 Tax=Salinispira pacifica TaxID=1307761 RepID=V5WDP5_9SPIO|nr:GAF domain-containing protein [Salinispira pacifica]AHC13907.1 Methionine-(R)-sulfoxide reductase [Salinispira pacifica]
MFEQLNIEVQNAEVDYPLLKAQAVEIVKGEPDLIANLSNISALIYHSLGRINWAGFYIWKPEDQQLVLGPFQGKPACVRIAPGSGVCGAAYSSGTTQRVKDVEAFPGHIACDSASKSEIVIPLVHDSTVWGVLDIDSPELNRFDEKDQEGLEALAAVISQLYGHNGM